MELINELRGQMKQLYQEMSELRKSINCCMDMQVKLQDSIKEEMISGELSCPFIFGKLLTGISQFWFPL